MSMYMIGCDLGNFNSRFSNLKESFSLQSVVSYGVERITEDLRTTQTIDFADGVRCGDVSIKHVRHKDDAWIESSEILRLFYAGLSELIPESYDVQDVTAVCAIPLSLYRFSSGRLAKHLSGNHSFERLGSSVGHNLCVKVVERPQGMTTLYKEFLNNEGEPSTPLALEQVAVIDIGSRDLNIIAAKEFQILPDKSETVHSGVWNLIEDVRNLLARAYNRPSLDEFEVEKSLRSGLFWDGSSYINIESITEDLIYNFTQMILANCLRLWPDISVFRRIYITGGGSLLVGEDLQNDFPQAQLCSDPVMSNTIGAAEVFTEGFIMEPQIKIERSGSSYGGDLFFIALVILYIMCSGKPDIIDAIIFKMYDGHPEKQELLWEKSYTNLEPF